jgi:hypothetical protein
MNNRSSVIFNITSRLVSWGTGFRSIDLGLLLYGTNLSSSRQEPVLVDMATTRKKKWQRGIWLDTASCASLWTRYYCTKTRVRVLQNATCAKNDQEMIRLHLWQWLLRLWFTEGHSAESALRNGKLRDLRPSPDVVTLTKPKRGMWIKKKCVHGVGRKPEVKWLLGSLRPRENDIKMDVRTYQAKISKWFPWLAVRNRGGILWTQ